MAKKEALPKLTTPVGVAKFPYLNTPDSGNEKVKRTKPVYQVQLVFDRSDDGVEAMLKSLDDLADASFSKAVEANGGKTTKIVKGKKKEITKNAPYRVLVDDDGQETGMVEVTAKMAAYYDDKKSGERVTLKPIFFDAAGHKIKKPKPIWSGSLLSVSGQLMEYGNEEIGYGVSLRLSAVQIIKLVSGGEGGNADSYGFGKRDDGYDSTEDDDDVNSEEEEEDDESTNDKTDAEEDGEGRPNF